MNPIVEKVYQIGIIPVIAFNSVDEALPLCKALADGGLPAAEVTFRTACAEECIRKIHEEMPEMLLGAGTVLTTEQADRAMAAGASFIVAPGFDPEVCKHVIDKGGIMMPGTCSAGEMQQAMNMGCEALKFFPALKRVQHPVQRHGPRLHCHRPDRTSAGGAAGRQPPPFRPVHHRQDPRRPLG